MQDRRPLYLKLQLCLLLGMYSTLAFSQVEQQLGTPNLLLGKTGAASISSLDSAAYNPSQLAGITDNHVQATLGLQWLSYTYQYPAHGSKTTSSIGLDGYPLPKVAWRINPKLVLGGTVVPFPVGVDIKAKGIPMLILGQESQVDINGKGQLNGYLDFILGYTLSSRLSLGLGFKYIGFQGDGKVNAAGNTGDGVASFSVKGTTIELGCGVKFRLNPRLTLGASASLYSMSSQESGISTALDSLGKENTDTEPKVTSTDSSLPLKQLRFGAGFRAMQKLMVYADVEYVRVAKDQEQYSIVDFATKKKDVADTLSGYLGVEFNWFPKRQILGGAYYEPSSVGQGSKGTDGEAGFGFLDMAFGLGAPPSRPHWGVGVGVREHFMRTLIRVKKKRYYRYLLTTETGLVFDRTSLGIDDSGEQPGAYVVNRVKIPIKVKYSF